MKYIFFLLISWTVHQQAFTQQETTKIYLIRHAEKDTAIKQDPPLTPQGIARSESLASILKDVPVDQLFSSKALRARQTLMPLSKAKGLSIDIYDTRDTASMERLFSLIRFKTSVICGHSNTIPEIVNSLIGKEIYPELDEAEFGKIWILTFYKMHLVDCSVLNY